MIKQGILIALAVFCFDTTAQGEEVKKPDVSDLLVGIRRQRNANYDNSFTVKPAELHDASIADVPINLIDAEYWCTTQLQDSDEPHTIPDLRRVVAVTKRSHWMCQQFLSVYSDKELERHVSKVSKKGIEEHDTVLNYYLSLQESLLENNTEARFKIAVILKKQGRALDAFALFSAIFREAAMNDLELNEKGWRHKAEIEMMQIAGTATAENLHVGPPNGSPLDLLSKNNRGLHFIALKLQRLHLAIERLVERAEAEGSSSTSEADEDKQDLDYAK
jgi:hypothetical protein